MKDILSIKTKDRQFLANVSKSLVACVTCVWFLTCVRIMVIVWRLSGNIIRTPMDYVLDCVTMFIVCSTLM